MGNNFRIYTRAKRKVWLGLQMILSLWSPKCRILLFSIIYRETRAKASCLRAAKNSGWNDVDNEMGWVYSKNQWAGYQPLRFFFCSLSHRNKNILKRSTLILFFWSDWKKIKLFLAKVFLDAFLLFIKCKFLQRWL